MPDEASTFTLHDGTEVDVLERPSDERGRLALRFRLPADCASPPPHVHPSSAETFVVAEGELELLVGREWLTLESGGSRRLAPGVRHTYRNRSGAMTVVRDVHEPHREFETYLRVVAALSHRYRSMAPTSPKAAARFALLLSRYRRLIRPADLPLRVATAALAPFARFLHVELPEPV